MEFSAQCTLLTCPTVVKVDLAVLISKRRADDVETRALTLVVG